jgi:hypothetical protein
VKKPQNYLIDYQGPIFWFYKKTGALIVCIYKDPPKKNQALRLPA